MTLAPVKLKVMSKEEADEQALELLERVGLADRADAYPIPAFRRTEAADCHRPRAGHAARM